MILVPEPVIVNLLLAGLILTGFLRARSPRNWGLLFRMPPTVTWKACEKFGSR